MTFLVLSSTPLGPLKYPSQSDRYPLAPLGPPVLTATTRPPPLTLGTLVVAASLPLRVLLPRPIWPPLGNLHTTLWPKRPDPVVELFGC